MADHTGKLRRSKDRKVANLVTPNGKQAAIANTFGLPAGRAHSCPGATDACESVCYAGKLEALYPSVRKLLLHNWNLVKDADQPTCHRLISQMMEEFNRDCDRRNAQKLFRIHWDGDFFSHAYLNAWKQVIQETPDIHYWVYTRTDWAAQQLTNIPNLSLYYSTDINNAHIGQQLNQQHGIRLAYLHTTFAQGKADMLNLTGRPAARCPENTKQIPLISTQGSACVTCDLCVHNRANILFSATKT